MDVVVKTVQTVDFVHFDVIGLITARESWLRRERERERESPQLIFQKGASEYWPACLPARPPTTTVTPGGAGGADMALITVTICPFSSHLKLCMPAWRCSWN